MLIPQNNGLSQEDAEMSNELYRHLKNYALIFPDTEEEVEHFIEVAQKHKATLPPTLNDADLILKTGLLRIQTSLNTSSSLEIEENMAQAAREGGEIPEEVLKKMHRDRENKEKQIENDSPE
jgi:hypothetical protein